MVASVALNSRTNIALRPGLISAEATVLTPGGPKLMGELEAGDAVITYDEGAVTVQGRTRVAIASEGRITPIVVDEFGNAPFGVSPNTLFLVNSRYCAHTFGSAKALVRAASFRNDRLAGGVGRGDFVFISLALPHPALIFVNGFVCEAPGSETPPEAPSSYPVLSDEEASLVYGSAGGAANVLKFVGQEMA